MVHTVAVLRSLPFSIFILFLVLCTHVDSSLNSILLSRFTLKGQGFPNASRSLQQGDRGPQEKQDAGVIHQIFNLTATRHAAEGVMRLTADAAVLALDAQLTDEAVLMTMRKLTTLVYRLQVTRF